MKKKKIITVILLTVLALCTVSLGINYGKLSHMTTLDAEVEEILDEPTVKEEKTNILLLGVDGEGLRADTIMLISVDEGKKSLKLLSIPRDTKVTLNSKKDIKINSCMGFDSRENLMISTIREITGMPIHYYCEVDFDGFIEIIDILDGVDYNVPYDMNYDDPTQDLHIHLSAGPQHLDGKAAHDFVRFRHNNPGSAVYAPGEYKMGDIGRINAQQNFIRELIKQKMQPQYLLKITDLLDAGYKYVKTNFSVTNALNLVGILKGADTTDIQTHILPGEGQYVGNVSYFIHDPYATRELIETEFGYRDGEGIEN